MRWTSEGTRKVKTAKVEPRYPELPSLSVSCSLEMKIALPLVAVQGILEPCTVVSLPNPHTPTFSSPTQAQAGMKALGCRWLEVS